MIFCASPLPDGGPLPPDWIAASNGIIGGHANNPRAKPGISNDTLRNVQNEVILLVKNPVKLQSTGRRPGELVPIEVLFSNWTFAGYPQWFGNAAVLSWSTSLAGAPLSNGSSSITTIPVGQGDTGAVAVFGVDIPPVTTASKILVEVKLEIAGTPVAANEWNLAVFPAAAAAKKCAVPVFAAPALLGAALQVCTNAAAVPPSLASQSRPFVLLRQGGLSEEDVAALARTGGFGVALSPESGGWPVCEQSAVGSVAAVKVSGMALPWWMSTGTTGTLVYSSSLTKSLGFAADDILDYAYLAVLDGGMAFTLDGMAASAAASVHIRAMPADGAYGSGGFETTISNDALVWEGKIATADLELASDDVGSAVSQGGRFLVSGLNLGQRAEPVVEFTIGRLVSYAVSETAAAAAASTTLSAELFPRKLGKKLRTVANAGDAKPCNISGSFCPVSHQHPPPSYYGDGEPNTFVIDNATPNF